MAHYQSMLERDYKESKGLLCDGSSSESMKINFIYTMCELVGVETHFSLLLLFFWLHCLIFVLVYL